MKVLITGSSGMLAQSIKKQCIQQNITYLTLGQNPENSDITWDTLEENKKELCSVTHIIHLAGANILEKRWTTARKKILFSSRIETLNTLFSFFEKNSHRLKYLVSTSAVGFYETKNKKIASEEEKPSVQFLGNLCENWEKAALQFKKLGGVKISIARLGVVFSKEGGALKEFIHLAQKKMLLLSGKGQFFIPWIHLEDATRAYLFFLKTGKEGTYNLVADNIYQKDLFPLIYNYTQKKPFLKKIHPFLFYLFLGKRASLITKGRAISSEKIQRTGFSFKHPFLEI